MSIHLSFLRAGFAYESAAGPLFQDLSLQFPAGWTGIVGANGSGKSTLLRLAVGELPPSGGRIDSGGICCRCEQEVDFPPVAAADFFTSCDSRSGKIRADLRLEPEMLGRWHTLSMGERKRIQVGTALFRQPDILAIDEPTNHLDAGGRRILIRALRNFRGIGLLVSHDRELLDLLCAHCLFLYPGEARMRAGGITAGQAEEAVEREHGRRQQRQLKNELKRSKQELQRRREKEQKAENRNSKRKVGKKDFDAKGKIDAARVSGRSRSAQDLAGTQAKIVARKAAELEAHGHWKAPEYGLKIPYGHYSQRNLLLDLPPESLSLGMRNLLLPELRVEPRDRIAITGDNGSGKSTLLRHLVSRLKLEPEQYLHMPQELPDTLKEEIHGTLRALSRPDYSRVMSVVASLGSLPERVINSRNCSPGEWRKLFFGLGVLREINLIILDEPTNHLDLPSIECLEAALRDCRCAMLLVSHDRFFLRQTCRVNWRIRTEGAENHLEKRAIAGDESFRE